jgi:2-polyprenyl-6-methoxyphenol hydroxylase-like FAD-dependent oxidoreductase
VSQADHNDILIIGGGIGGLTLALNLHAAGFGDRVRVFDVVPEFKPVGGGINLGPHAIKVYSELGLLDALLAVSKQPQDYAFFTKYGQLVYREPWGKAAGHHWPHISIHRAELHNILASAVVDRMGPRSLGLGRKCVDIVQEADSVTARFVPTEGGPAESRTGGVLVGCDGVHSVARAKLYPEEGPPRFHGINLWRGVARHKPFLTGASIARVGAMRATIIIYPIRDNVDAEGNQLVNWVAEVDSNSAVMADWNGKARLEDFYPVYEHWNFDWIDVAALIRSTEPILAYPMVDRDPLKRWTFGRMTLLGDAAHPMFPRGGNGGAQAILDGAAFARHLAQNAGNPAAALQAYEAERLPATTQVVLQNRSAPPNILVDTVEQRTGGKRFDRIEDVISPDELREILASYQKTAGYHVDIVNKTARS